MAKKKLPPLEGIGRDPENKLIIQKSHPLFALGRSDLTLAELKILDMYLARIDTRKPEQRTIKLTKGQLEEALGVTRINKADLKQRLRNLYQPIDLANGDKKRFHLVGLFEEAEAEQDEDGIWQVTLTCTQSAMKYIFKAELLGYFRYGLRGIISLTSRYSYVLFTYLERNRFRKTWEISLDELKEILKCENDESYNEFKIFNQRILKRCQKEIQEKTECRFTYEPIRKGRSVAAIRFTVKTLRTALDEIEPDVSPQIAFDDDTISFLSGACCGEFTHEQMEVIFSIISTKTLPENPDGIDFARYHYLDRMYRTMQLAASKKPIKHRFDYFLAMLKNEK